RHQPAVPARRGARQAGRERLDRVPRRHPASRGAPGARTTSYTRGAGMTPALPPSGDNEPIVRTLPGGCVITDPHTIDPATTSGVRWRKLLTLLTTSADPVRLHRGAWCALLEERPLRYRSRAGYVVEVDGTFVRLSTRGGRCFGAREPQLV